MIVGIAATLTLVGLVVIYTQSQRTHLIDNDKVVAGRIVSSVVAGLSAIMVTGSATIAQQYAQDIKGAVGLDDFSFIRPDGKQAFLDNDTIKAVNSRYGQTLFMERSESREQRLYAEKDPLFQRAKGARGLVGKVNENGESYTILMPIENKPVCHQCHGDSVSILGFARLTSSLQHVNQMVSSNRNQAILVMLAVLVLYLILTYLFLNKVVIVPIRRVTDAMFKVEKGDLSQQVPELGRDELGRMARSFNAMIRQILQIHTGLEMEQNKLTTIILNAGEGIVVTDRDERIVLVNPAAEALLGEKETQIVTKGFHRLVDDPSLIERLLEHPDSNYAESVSRGDRYLSIMAARIEQQGELLGMAALLRDVTTQKRREAHLRAISYTDELTGLLNRRSLTAVLHQGIEDAVGNQRPLSLLMMDLDHFKTLNDTHGHAMGDQVLMAFGGLLKRRLRDADYACRYGGEEFCAILPNTPMAGARKTAEDIRRAVMVMDCNGVTVTVSIGVATLDQLQSHTPNGLLKAADEALYEAKGQGRNRTVEYGCEQ